MASVARTGQLRRRTRLVSVPVQVEDPVTLVVRDIQQNILDMQKQYECPICLELIAEPRATDCGHYFCKECILQYISLSSKNPPIKCPLCKETVTKRSLVECSSMGDISQAIRQLVEGFHLDTGTTVSTPYVGNIVSSKTNENTVLASSTPKKRSQIETIRKESSGGDKIETFESNNNGTDTETKEDSSAKSELDTSLENKIKGSAMKSRSLIGTKFSGFGDSNPLKINQTKKNNFSNIISDILGISETLSFDQSNASTISFRTGNIIPLSSGDDATNHNMKLTTGTNNNEMKPPTFTNAKGFEFASSKSLLENKTNSFDNLKIPNLEISEDEYRSKRLKSGTETNSMVSFVSGINLLETANDRNNLEQTETDTKSWFTNEASMMSIASDIYSATTESLSGLADFSPIKYPNGHNLNETYDILPTPRLELSNHPTGTNFSSTLQLASTKPEDYIYEGNILEMTFSDNSQSNNRNSEKGTSKYGTETNHEDEITLTQFLTQRPVVIESKDSSPLSQIPETNSEQTTFRNEISFHSNNASQPKDISILEPSYLGINKMKFQDDYIEHFSIEMSKDIVSVNQTKFEMELKDLISETETLDSIIFTQPYITEYSLANQNAQEDTETQYTLMDIFSPIHRNTSSPKLTKSQSQHSNLSTNEFGIGGQTLQNLTNESLENFNTFNSTLRITNSQSETPVLPQKGEFQYTPMVTTIVQDSQLETAIPETDGTLNFSRFSELIQTEQNALVYSNSFSHRVSDSYMEEVPFMEVRNY